MYLPEPGLASPSVSRSTFPVHPHRPKADLRCGQVLPDTWKAAGCYINPVFRRLGGRTAIRAPEDAAKTSPESPGRHLHLAPDVDAQTMAIQTMLDEFEETLLGGDEPQLAAISKQLWKYRRLLPDMIVERFHADRVKVPRVAFELIGGMAGRRAPALLKRIAADGAVADIVRWGARRRAGWAARGQPKARRAFLASLLDPDDTLVEALLQAGDRNLADGEILQEVLAFLQVLGPDQRHAFVRDALEQQVPALPWILRCLIHLDVDPDLQMLCISALINLSDTRAVGALDRVARSSRNVAVRQEAEAAARRLRFQVLRPDSAATVSTERPLPDLERVMLSSVDGDGSQLLALTRQWATRQFLIVMVYLNDRDGIRDILGASQRPSPEVGEAPIEELVEPPMVEIDVQAARGALAAAYETGVAKGRKPPLHYELWEPYFHDQLPPAADEQATSVEMDDTPFAHRHDLVLRSGQLLDHPAFASWLVDSEPIAESIGPEFFAGKRDIPKSRYAQLVNTLFGGDTRATLRGRLQRQAWLLDRQHEGTLRDIALAAAAALAESAPDSLVAHPLLRGIIGRSLDQYMAAPFIGLF